jgi:hypothetical protein
LLLAGPALAGQRPVFRTGVDLVTVDVTVLDRSGAPIDGPPPTSSTRSSRPIVWPPHR